MRQRLIRLQNMVPSYDLFLNRNTVSNTTLPNRLQPKAHGLVRYSTRYEPVPCFDARNDRTQWHRPHSPNIDSLGLVPSGRIRTPLLLVSSGYSGRNLDGIHVQGLSDEVYDPNIETITSPHPNSHGRTISVNRKH